MCGELVGVLVIDYLQTKLMRQLSRSRGWAKNGDRLALICCSEGVCISRRKRVEIRLSRRDVVDPRGC